MDREDDKENSISHLHHTKECILYRFFRIFMEDPLMARPFTSKEAKNTINNHEKIIRNLSEAAKIVENSKEDILNASNRLVTRTSLNILKQVPVEEVNKDKQGIRVKALRDHGYANMADLSTASVYQLASIRGISEDTAYTIHRIVNDYIRKTQQTVKISLSTDDKNQEATSLVRAINQYRRSKVVAEICNNILSANQKDIENAISDVSGVSSGIKWLFASKKKKQKAIDSYHFLSDKLSGDYGSTTQKQIESIQSIKEIYSADYVWGDFSQNSVSYFNALEEVNPGVLGNGDAAYGLPEDLAREIQEESFFPDGLKCELRRYQEWGVKFILHQGNVLFGDEMGLGKTVQAIASMVSLRNTGATHFIVVCPASVIENWCREVRKMSKLSVTKIHGTGRNSALNAWIRTGGVAITTYETTGYLKLGDLFKYSMLVVDEAHYIKNPEARRTVNVKRIGQNAERMLFMTGTALENKVDEMIELLKMLNPKIAESARRMAFMSSATEFRNIIAPVYYRRKREDVLTELPNLVIEEEWIELNKVEEAVYEQAVLDKNTSKARRVSWNVDDIRKSSKASRLLELVAEAKESGRKILVFSFFLDTIQSVTSLLGAQCLNPINGSVSPQRRQMIIDEFDKAPAGTVLAAQIQSGGTGLNIQSASVVILCEPQFKPSIENQAISRAYRMGQTRNVLVYRLLSARTIDERIMDILERKQQEFDAFTDKSVEASQSVELDNLTFGQIIQEEIDRINEKRKAS